MFFKLIIKNLIQRPGRFILTGLAVVLGVASVVGVFTFTDGLRATFNRLSDDIECCYDVEVLATSAFGNDLSAPPLPIELADELLALDEVAGIQPRIAALNVIVEDAAGERQTSDGGAPNFGTNWESRTTQPRNFIVDGREPTADGEFVVDADLFAAGEFKLGDSYRIESPLVGVETFELVGVYNFGDEDVNRTVGARIISFSEETALRFVNADEGYDSITVTGLDQDNDEALADLIALSIDAENLGYEALTQEQRAEEQQDAFGGIVSIFQTTLLAFAGIIFFVAAFLIFNVFNITLGQRVKELSLYRSIGATGNQVTRMVLLEALVLGIVATGFGILFGYALSFLLRLGLAQVGFPNDVELVLTPTTALYGLIIGVFVTLAAALVPSLRARSITPIDGLSDNPTSNAAVEPSIKKGVGASLVGVALLVLAVLGNSWLAVLALPAIAAFFLYRGAAWTAPNLNWLPSAVTLFLGLACLTIARFFDLDLSVTFALIGAGAVITLMSVVQVGGIIGSPIARVLGGIPSAVIMLGVGILLGLGAAGSLVAGTISAIDGTPSALIGAVIGAVILGALAYLVVRTAFSVFNITGKLGKLNAARNPQRTSTTAAALMISVALITTVSVIGESIKRSVDELLATSIESEIFVAPADDGLEATIFPLSVSEDIARISGVESVFPYQFNFFAFAGVAGDGLTVDKVEALRPEIISALAADLSDSEFREFEQANSVEISVEDVFAADPASFDSHIDLDFIEYEQSIVDSSAEPIFLEEDFALENGYEVGDPYYVVFQANQEVAEFKVGGIFQNDFLTTSPRVITIESWRKSNETGSRYPKGDTFLSVKIDQAYRGDSSVPDVESTVEGEVYDAFVDRYSEPTTLQIQTELVRHEVAKILANQAPGAVAQTQDEVSEDAAEQINTILQVINVLLVLAIFIALLSVAISLSLSVFERTREIGLMRAVGTTRPQTRRSIRWEGAIIAVFGAFLGLILGIGFGVLAAQKLPDSFVTVVSIPIGTIVTLLIGSMLAGLVSALFPAWRAGRMNVLDAISHE